MMRRDLMRKAIELSRHCPPSSTAFAAGVVLARDTGEVVSTGFSRELGPHWHAEEVALEKAAAAGISTKGLTLYSSLEPCGMRLSGRISCALKIAEAGIRSVFFAAQEPTDFIEHPDGAAKLRAAGIHVEQLNEFANDALSSPSTVVDHSLLALRHGIDKET